MRNIRMLCGGLLACRSIGPGKFEVTMSDRRGKERLLDGIKIRETRLETRELSSEEMVVSFLNLPAYITDEDIIGKLRGWGVEALSPVKREMWPGTNIADGTRFVKVKFNKTVQSLPYSTKFSTATGDEYFRVIHDRQVKVCRLCIQPGHIVRDCPSFICFKCGKQGHYARECEEQVECGVCHEKLTRCECGAAAAIRGEQVNAGYSDISDSSNEAKEDGEEQIQEDGKEEGDDDQDPTAAMEESGAGDGKPEDVISRQVQPERGRVRETAAAVGSRREQQPLASHAETPKVHLMAGTGDEEEEMEEEKEQERRTPDTGRHREPEGGERQPREQVTVTTGSEDDMDITREIIRQLKRKKTKMEKKNAKK